MNSAKEMQEQYKAYRKTVYEKYPQVDAFEKSKKKMDMLSIDFCLIH